MEHAVLRLGVYTDMHSLGKLLLALISPWSTEESIWSQGNQMLWAVDMYLAVLENIYEHINSRLLDMM